MRWTNGAGEEGRERERERERERGKKINNLPKECL